MVVKNIFLSVFAIIVNCYNHSIFEKIFSNIAEGIKKSFSNSRIVKFFKTLKNKRMWKESFSARVVCSPFAICRRFYHKNCVKIEKIKEESVFLNFISDLLKIHLKDYATVLLAMGTGMLFAMSVFAKWTEPVYIFMTAAVLVVGMYFSLANLTVANLFSKSHIVQIFRKIFIGDTDDKKAWEIKRIPHMAAVMTIAIIFGFVSMIINPLGLVIGVAGALVLLAILIKPCVGVFLFVPASAILPTMALVGLIGITGVAYILHLLFSKNASYVSTPFQPWIAILSGVLVYASITSVTPFSSIKILFVYLAFTFSYVLIVNNIKSKSQWRSLVILLILSATAVALYGIYQNFFVAQTTQSWVDGEMFEEIKTRVYSTLDNPNVLGQYFIMMMPIAFSLLVAIRGNYNKLLYAICNCLMFACLIYTWSRGAWVGVVIGIGFFVLIKDRRWLVLCIAALFIVPSVLPASILNRLLSIGNLEDSSTAYRVAVWLGSINLLKDYWFTGIGLGPDAFLKIYPQYALGGADFALHSHNFYLQWIVDMGVMGLITYIGIIVTGFSRIASIKGKKNSLIKNVLLAMAGGLLGYLFHGMAENLWYNYRMILVFWVYFGILQRGTMFLDNNMRKGDIIR